MDDLNNLDDEVLKLDLAPIDPGFIKFYGLFWSSQHVDWDSRKLLGRPQGWLGKGKLGKNLSEEDLQMNFGAQKGVYILYDANLHPVYAGQAGLERDKAGAGRTIFDRLAHHRKGIYRNGWSLFSWFGFLSTGKLDLRRANDDSRLNVKWEAFQAGPSSLNDVLASFEAILIEGFSPRFNSRGGDLKKAILVNQFDKN